jgi:uncharacterized protein YggE
MKSTPVLLLFVVICGGTLSLRAQQSLVNPKPTIDVSLTGKASAKPDTAILFMTLRSTSPLAANALDENNKKAEDVKAHFTALGLKNEQVKFTGNRFTPSGGGMYYGGGQRPPGFEVYNNFFVYIEGPELGDATEFNKRLSALLDDLSKVGAASSNFINNGNMVGGSAIVAFSVKDPGPYEKQAALEALDKARPLADEIARHMNVQITGRESTTVMPSGNRAVGMPATLVDELPYEYYSSSMDEVPVRVRVDVRYAYK